MTLTPVVNLILGSLTVAGQAVILLIALSMIWRQVKVLEFFGKNAVLFSFLAALVATLGSLFYSEVAGYEPCKLCWFQRIFMYSQVVLLGIALGRKSYEKYESITLSAVGAAIAGYHYLLQVGEAPGLPCAAVGYSVSCSQRFVMTLGYITIPMMALTAFVMITSFFLAQSFLSRSKSAKANSWQTQKL